MNQPPEASANGLTVAMCVQCANKHSRRCALAIFAQRAELSFHQVLDDITYKIVVHSIELNRIELNRIL